MAYKKIADRRAASARNYRLNKEVYVVKAKRRKERLYSEVIVPAKSMPCLDCKGTFPPVCMDFDHVRGEKRFDISNNHDKVSLVRLLEEIAKCDVVCSNCHRIRTALRSEGG